jgi:poly-gamma-glutamate synthesis protein (capsule biosynthesis protein)
MINIGFTGDFCPWERMEQRFLNNNWKDSFSGVKSFFDNNHLNVLDLECPLTTVNATIPKTGPHLKALPQTAEILEYLNCKLTATANNHFKDYGWEGMQQTYDSLNKYGISHIGSGANLDEASQPYFWNYNDLTIAFINATDREWSTTEDHNPGCNPLDAVGIYNAIKKANQKADFTIIIAHGGHEHYNFPSPRIKQLYRFFIDAGAAAVIGHHTHIIGAYEVYKNAPIFYSLGNFFFDWKGMRNHHWNFGMLVKLSLAKNEPVRFETIYVEQNNENSEVKFVLPEKEKELSVMQLSINEIMQDDQQLKQKFEYYSNSLKPLMNTWIEPYRGKLLPSLHKKGLIPDLMGKKKKQLLTVLIQCDAHRDVLLHAIDQRKKL